MNFFCSKNWGEVSRKFKIISSSCFLFWSFKYFTIVRWPWIMIAYSSSSSTNIWPSAFWESPCFFSATFTGGHWIPLYSKRKTTYEFWSRKRTYRYLFVHVIFTIYMIWTFYFSLISFVSYIRPFPSSIFLHYLSYLVIKESLFIVKYASFEKQRSLT